MRLQANSFTLRLAPKAAISTLLGAGLLALPLASAMAASVSVGAGARASISSYDEDASDVNDGESITLDNARLYVSGKATDLISFMFNTQYESGGDVSVMDAAAQFAFSDQFNIWAGRFLPPSDRANLYGPYYASNWAVYQDGVQDGYPSVAVGRNNGIMYWGQFGIAKVSAGLFDSTQGVTDDLLAAARLQLDFWDAEGGYYLNGTYYGEKDLLAVGIAAQSKGSGKAYSGDFLLEKKLGNAGVVTVEAEYAKYDELGGYAGGAVPAFAKSDGYYLLGAYLFPAQVGIGKFQVLGKYGEASFEAVGGDIDQKTGEFNLNYIISSFNARLSLYYLDKSFDPDVGSDTTTYGIGLQVQM